MTKRSSYGSWSQPQHYEASTDHAPATRQAQSQFGWGAIITGVLGFAMPGLWVVTGLCVLVLLVSPAVGKLEESAVEEARTSGGGGCQVGLAGLIIGVLAVICFLAALSMVGGGG